MIRRNEYIWLQRMEGASLKDLAAQNGVTIPRVRQLIKKEEARRWRDPVESVVMEVERQETRQRKAFLADCDRIYRESRICRRCQNDLRRARRARA